MPSGGNMNPKSETVASDGSARPQVTRRVRSARGPCEAQRLWHAHAEAQGCVSTERGMERLLRNHTTNMPQQQISDKGSPGRLPLASGVYMAKRTDPKRVLLRLLFIVVLRVSTNHDANNNNKYMFV